MAKQQKTQKERMTKKQRLDRFTAGADGTGIIPRSALRPATAEDYRQVGLPVPEHLLKQSKNKSSK